ncbi:chromate resistance protein ChrB domain-containing protein [Megalodesulfovibrio gigas]|uniref:Putative ChrB protein n=1 Tax=Megalodesulfovibrio gigas (strain ATCC 19364 / DSM 1382 / NCIMB 9332 / VKM B-1759) TaxID=1121448 RepID=T2GCM0_MEGG1|nr:chromate resistance protein ChrB domain-containing protein [Megalodesulfovibrio gigas]AGW14325.1 putative ChrB protein [Megalodesulfovibrio gigas DSM 1382 = ATCC 19364]
MTHPWLLCIHNIPPKPAYLRAKVAKRLAALGAVALKNAVYALPDTAQHREDLGWLVREIEDGGGKAFVVEAAFVAGMEDAQVRALFQQAREQDYTALLAQARGVEQELETLEPDAAARALAELCRQVAEVRTVDFFNAPGGDVLEGLVGAMKARLQARDERAVLAAGEVARSLETFQGKLWITRAGVHVDRIASAWLIRRFIDPDAAFAFVETTTHSPASGEVTFDMQQADFSHEGERCTFETFIHRLGLHDDALARLGEMVHDIDLREARYGHAETPGLAAALAGVALRHAGDQDRLQAGGVVLDAFYEAFRLGTHGNCHACRTRS